MFKTFDDFINKSQWVDIISHYKSISKTIEENINSTLEKEKANFEKLRAFIRQNYTICKINENLLKDCKKELISGNIVGVDGTYITVDFTTGFQARIGIVATNYKNSRQSYTTYIYEPFIDYTKEDIMEQLKELKKKYEHHERINSMQIRAVMLFMERRIVLGRPEEYKLVQGDIFPYELRTGQGKLRGLNTCLSLGEQLLTNRKIIAIQTSTTDPRLRYLGRGLESGEYVVLYDYCYVLNDYLETAHFNDYDMGLFKRFIANNTGNFVLGIYKFKKRSYVFQCHKENVERLIHIVFADSSFQPVRGYPLLLDYADIVCSKMLSASDFKHQLEVKLAKHEELEYDIDESILRRR